MTDENGTATATMTRKNHRTKAQRQQKKARLANALPSALRKLSACTICPRNCGVDRTQGEKGLCNTTDKAVVYGCMPHFGEEPPLSGSSGSGQNGSGTIFFSHCNLGCCFCQNDNISLRGEGEPAEPDQIARAMLMLQDRGCHNINLVTPTHVVPFILQALDLAMNKGLNIPLVYNTSGYESPGTLSLLDDIVDIYMPDFKFWDPNVADMACNAPDYPEIARQAVKIMHGQVGDLKLDENGIAVSGLLVRHLVLPDNLSGTGNILEFLAKEISPDTRVNVMSQYHPVGKARQIDGLSRPVSPQEFHRAVATARSLGLSLVR